MTEEPVIEAEVVDMEIISPQAPSVTDEDVMSPEEQEKFVAELMLGTKGKVQPTKETAHLPRSQQVRSKYKGDGSLREEK